MNCHPNMKFLGLGALVMALAAGASTGCVAASGSDADVGTSTSAAALETEGSTPGTLAGDLAPGAGGSVGNGDPVVGAVARSRRGAKAAAVANPGTVREGNPEPFPLSPGPCPGDDNKNAGAPTTTTKRD